MTAIRIIIAIVALGLSACASAPPVPAVLNNGYKLRPDQVAAEKEVLGHYRGKLLALRASPEALADLWAGQICPAIGGASDYVGWLRQEGLPETRDLPPCRLLTVARSK